VRDGELTCRELVELVSDYLEGALPAAERRRFEQHLDDCPLCLDYVDQMRTTLAVLGHLDEAALQEPVRDDLVRAFREWPRGDAAEA